MTPPPDPPAGNSPDEQLLDRVAHGDEAAFRILYCRHTPRLHALASRLLGGHAADTDDVLQETWIRAITRLSTFKRNSALGTWLCGISVNVAWELIRRRRPEVIETMIEDRPDSMSDEADRVDLETALSRLPDGYRLAVVLHDVEGYTHHEIARFLGVAEGTSRSNLFRARRALRAMLASHERIPE